MHRQNSKQRPIIVYTFISLREAWREGSTDGMMEGAIEKKNRATELFSFAIWQLRMVRIYDRCVRQIVQTKWFERSWILFYIIWSGIYLK